jgi:hypothetical protein
LSNWPVHQGWNVQAAHGRRFHLADWNLNIRS